MAEHPESVNAAAQQQRGLRPGSPCSALSKIAFGAMIFSIPLGSLAALTCARDLASTLA
jgi:hypothetical protein